VNDHIGEINGTVFKACAFEDRRDERLHGRLGAARVEHIGQTANESQIGMKQLVIIRYSIAN
jgi:hypothetical protein